MITDAQWVEKKGPVLSALLGGPTWVAVFTDYHVDKITNTRRLEDKHGIPESTIRTRITAGRTLLRSLGLMPAEWERVIQLPKCGTMNSDAPA